MGVLGKRVRARTPSRVCGCAPSPRSVAQVRQVLESLTESQKAIGRIANEVLSNAQSTQEHSAEVGNHISDLVVHANGITRVLEQIKSIANRSDQQRPNARSFCGEGSGQRDRQQHSSCWWSC